MIDRLVRWSCAAVFLFLIDTSCWQSDYWILYCIVLCIIMFNVVFQSCGWRSCLRKERVYRIRWVQTQTEDSNQPSEPNTDLTLTRHMNVCEQVRLLRSQLDQRQKNGTDGVHNPEGGGLENGMDSHLLDLQSEFCLVFILPIYDLSLRSHLVCSSFLSLTCWLPSSRLYVFVFFVFILSFIVHFCNLSSPSSFCLLFQLCFLFQRFLFLAVVFSLSVLHLRLLVFTWRHVCLVYIVILNLSSSPLTSFSFSHLDLWNFSHVVFFPHVKFGINT